jgi:hypothetical protein
MGRIMTLTIMLLAAKTQRINLRMPWRVDPSICRMKAMIVSFAGGNGDNSTGGKYPLMELVLGNIFRGVGKKSCKVFSEAESNRD